MFNKEKYLGLYANIEDAQQIKCLAAQFSLESYTHEDVKIELDYKRIVVLLKEVKIAKIKLKKLFKDVTMTIQENENIALMLGLL